MKTRVKIYNLASYQEDFSSKTFELEVPKGAKLLAVKAFPDGLHAIMEQDDAQEEKGKMRFTILPPEGELPKDLKLEYVDSPSFISASPESYGVLILHVYKIVE
jgi:hypothetical protein